MLSMPSIPSSLLKMPLGLEKSMSMPTMMTTAMKWGK
jgi:hypothetical protein